MAKKKEINKSVGIEELAEKLGIKKENLDFGLKKDRKQVEEAVKKAAKFMGVN